MNKVFTNYFRFDSVKGDIRVTYVIKACVLEYGKCWRLNLVFEIWKSWGKERNWNVDWEDGDMEREEIYMDDFTGAIYTNSNILNILNSEF